MEDFAQWNEQLVSMASPLPTKKLAELIAKRHTCLTQLRDLGCQQATLIAAGEMAALLRLIAAKNQLIIALQTIEQGLTPFHNQDPASRVWDSPAERAACAQQVQECKALLEEVMQLERDNEAHMIQRRDNVAGQLQAARTASTARGAYQAQQNWQRPPTPMAPHTPANQQTPMASPTPMSLDSEA